MFSGGLLIPPVFGVSITLLGGFEATYRAVALLALASAAACGGACTRD